MFWDHNQISMTFIGNEELKHSTLRSPKNEDYCQSDGDIIYFSPMNAGLRNLENEIDLDSNIIRKMTVLPKNKVELSSV